MLSYLEVIMEWEQLMEQETDGYTVHSDRMQIDGGWIYRSWMGNFESPNKPCAIALTYAPELRAYPR